VFEKACRYVGGTAATLGSQDTLGKAAHFYYSWGTDPRCDQLYRERLFKFNPVFPTALFFGVEETHCVTDCLPREEFCRTRFAKEYLNPQGLVDGLFSNLEKSTITCATFVVARTIRQGFVDDEMRRRFALLVPHIRRAILVGKVIDLKTIEAAALADSLDTLNAGMFLVDATGRIAHANLSGHMMVSEARVVCAPGGKLRAIDPQTHQALLDSFTAAGSGDAVLGRKGIAVPLSARDGDRYVAHVLPLTCGSRRKAGVSYAAVATVFINKAALDLPSPPEAVSRAFQLTPTELRVLFAIIEVGTAPEVADVLGISEGTVKWHLRHLFEKTGTHRQADLVKLVAGFANPLVG
jgi:DNA-binding CsgD family transcriptional regulator